ncbi:MAG: sigma-70 family RNA polymerase sigma factor [Gemmataceae bacterium]|nr:sigma-70 family RNA polymerase sigma factor [Gemmataceae bacterium]
MFAPTFDREALASHWFYLYRLASRAMDARLRCKVDPGDVVQEALTRAFQSRDLFRGTTPTAFRAWLRTILRNTLRNLRRAWYGMRRNIHREQSLERLAGAQLSLTDADPTDLLDAKETRERLTVAIARLPPSTRWLLTLRYGEQLTFPEIGHRLGKSAAAVRQLVVRVLRRLRIRMALPPG